MNLFQQMHEILWKQFEEWLMKLVCKHTVKFPSLKTLTISVHDVSYGGAKQVKEEQAAT